MHDFLLAKEIIDETLGIVKEKKIDQKIKSVSVEIGKISMAHDGHEEHEEDISVENLEFGLGNIKEDTILKDTQFKITKIEGDNWRITNIEV